MGRAGEGAPSTKTISYTLTYEVRRRRARRDELWACW